MNKCDGVINKVVYKYDSGGKQIGYSIFDANGKLTVGTASATPSQSRSKNAKSSRR